MNERYYVGLDMGTASLGWAVTDEKYRLIRRKGKDLWGVRLFDTANTAAERRTNRVAKRRLARERAREGYLRMVFAPAIEAVDPGFYQRLDDSKYCEEDKIVKQPFALFAGNGYTDKDYYEQYPTVFHLRKELLTSKEPHDVRLVFLALLNMYKHRGHFLNSNIGEGSTGSIEEMYENLRSDISQYMELELPDIDDYDKLKNILTSKEYSASRRVELIIESLNLSKSKDKNIVEIWKLTCGLKGKLSNLFAVNTEDDEAKNFSISFKDGSFDEKVTAVENILGEEQFDIFMQIKEIHDHCVLANIMKGYEYLSFARVDSYEKHGKDLAILKKLIKENAPGEYYGMFREMANDNYSAYVGSVNYKNGPVRRWAKCDRDAFFKKVSTLVSKMPESQDREYVLQEISKDTFLPKQLTASNGVIPNQVHKKEMKKILKNAEGYLPFLLDKDESGYTVSERIIKMFEFQIPYYVGPIAEKVGEDSKSKNVWSVRLESGRVYPWNFEQKIDVKESAEKFISRMVNKCTYLNGEQVLPKNSLLYERFTLLNELNNLRINGEKISVELKQNIYNDLFKSGKKVTARKLKEYLKTNGYVEAKEDPVISGIDGDFTNRLANYGKFAAVFGVETLTYDQEKMAEDIIKWSTLYGDTKSFLKQKITENYGEDKLTKDQLKRILGFKFKDWGRLSKALLETRGCSKDDGVIDTVIGRMWNENYNLMELIESRNFTYKEEISERSMAVDKLLGEIKYEDLDELYISAPVKRMTWQTILALKEICKVMGYGPSKIFVEMARDPNAEKKRTESRRSKFAYLYRSVKDDTFDWQKAIKETDEGQFRSKKLYLYYTQKGRCMYTGERIELSDLFKDNLYDIDHIYPRHFVKDDSLDNNMVLVKKEKNAHKSDTFPIEADIRGKMSGFWHALADGGFITKEKLKRLMRTDGFSDDERVGFINRQLVETRQGTKVITDLFKQTFPDTDIVYVKAPNVSDFRHEFDLIKCRMINNFHHANDAYLNIVVGNVYDVKFTRNPYNFIKDYEKGKEKYNMAKMFKYNVSRNGVTAWSIDGEKSIDNVRKVMARNTPLVTRMNYERHGKLYNVSLIGTNSIKEASKDMYIPSKLNDNRLSDVKKYGGYSDVKGTYFFLVEYTEKGKRVRSLEALPLYLKDHYNTKEQLEEYCREMLGLKEPSVRYRRIKMYSKIRVNGFEVLLTGRSENRLLISNAEELKISYQDAKYIKNLAMLKERDVQEEIYEECGATREENGKVFLMLKDKFVNGIYAKRINPIGDKLDENKFNNLSLKQQAEIILQLVGITQQTNYGANLELIGASKKTGTMKPNKVLSSYSEVLLINQSVLGIYEERVDLLTI